MLLERKSGLVVSELDSQFKDCGFESCLIQILDGNGLKAMPGSIPAPILVHSWKNKKIWVDKWGKPTKKTFLKKVFYSL